jgi:poly(3-hydroxybutyrate) depolymerase
MNRLHILCACILAMLITMTAGAAEWPKLPRENGAITVPAQDAPREVTATVTYPSGKLENVRETTGLMLTLHNWGGTGARGTASPRALADNLDVVAITVDYLHSGEYKAGESPPYDFGYLQANDALRALWAVYDGLQRTETPFDSGRLYATGGSGGGNVTLMCNKLAPRTFAAIVDNCGMPRLTDDIAFGEEGGSRLNAGYSRDADAENYLSPDAQAIRFVGHPDHTKHMKAIGNAAKIVVVHGTTDDVCPFPDAVEMVDNLTMAGLDVLPWFLTNAHLDGKTFNSTGHSLGDRTRIALKFGAVYIAADSPDARRLSAPNDFDQREVISYQTENGRFDLDYTAGYPVFRFIPDPE